MKWRSGVINGFGLQAGQHVVGPVPNQWTPYPSLGSHDQKSRSSCLSPKAAGRVCGQSPWRSAATPLRRCRRKIFQEASIKPKTRTCYQSSARACETVFGALHLDEIDRRAIAEFVSARKRSGLTDTTVRRDLAFSKFTLHLGSPVGMAGHKSGHNVQQAVSQRGTPTHPFPDISGIRAFACHSVGKPAPGAHPRCRDRLAQGGAIRSDNRRHRPRQTGNPLGADQDQLATSRTHVGHSYGHSARSPARARATPVSVSAV